MNGYFLLAFLITGEMPPMRKNLGEKDQSFGLGLLNELSPKVVIGPELITGVLLGFNYDQGGRVYDPN